jgi:hypothetical protein
MMSSDRWPLPAWVWKSLGDHGFVGYQKLLVKKKVQQDAAISMALTAFRDNIRVFDAWMQLLRTRRKQGFDPLIILCEASNFRSISHSVRCDRCRFVIGDGGRGKKVEPRLAHRPSQQKLCKFRN